jgi:phospholipase C
MDTTSILRFITRRFELPTLHGITVRDQAIASRNQPPLGDLTSALDFGSKP